MATQIVAATVPFGAVEKTFRESTLAKELFTAVLTWNKKRQTRLALDRLTDDQLNDIGLERKYSF
jgi:uncharacterized protein YjiS (DUF1127 family)